jgi:plastocyanin
MSPLRALRRGRLRLSSGCAIVAAAMLGWAPPSESRGQPAVGRVTGTVKLTVASSAPSAASAYDRRGVGPRPRPQPELRNVIIHFDGLPAGAVEKTTTSIAQQDEQFTPHVVAVTAGSQVSFPNRDPFFHNVFSLSRGSTFDLGRFAGGANRHRVFTRPGLVKVYCHIHAQMSAVIRVFDHGWFVIPEEDGSFAIDNVPPGEHTLVAWHERIGERRDRVTIRPGEATEITFTLPVLEPAK